MEPQNFEIRNLLIPATFLCLWITGFFGDAVEQVLALVLIFSFGILHGSNDLYLIHRLQLGSLPERNALILVLYVCFVLLMALLFYLWPVFALWAFIGFSAYHFGEQHWAGKADGPSGVRGVFGGSAC